jgi:outer membrane protein OmpA-like peptidoglycan-associated protein
MNFIRLNGTLLVGTAAFFVVSCDLVKDITYTVNPNPLEMHGDSVKVSITVNVPEKGIQKKAKAEITPKIGSTAIGTWYVNGSKVTGNGTTIDFKTGGTATFEETMAYDPSMEAADVVITGKIYKQTKEKGAIPETKIADATIITPYLVDKSFKVLTEQDALVRQFDKTTTATFNFEKGKSDVRANEIKDADILALMAWLQAAQTNPKIKITSIEINGYASPDGEVAKNDNLSSDRTVAARKTLTELMKKAKLTVYADTSAYKLAKFGEDFEGFKSQLAATTSIPEADKNLFIRILEMTKDPEQREKDMINLGKAYTELERDVFPMIRRAVVVVKYTEYGLTDDELRTATIQNPNSLSVEELLFTAGKLTTDANERARIYGIAAANYSSDFRTHTNLGTTLFELGNTKDAAVSYKKANEIKANPISDNNLAASLILEGNRAAAKKLLSKSKTSVSDYNTGIIDIMEGNYSAADKNITQDSYNRVLALILVNKLDAARKASAALNETAELAYLKAIIEARSGASTDVIVAKLKTAISKNSALKDKASKDREFIKIMNDASFIDLIK